MDLSIRLGHLRHDVVDAGTAFRSKIKALVIDPDHTSGKARRVELYRDITRRVVCGHGNRRASVAPRKVAHRIGRPRDLEVAKR